VGEGSGLGTGSGPGGAGSGGRGEVIAPTFPGRGLGETAADGCSSPPGERARDVDRNEDDGWDEKDESDDEGAEADGDSW
jgi:hypothetical protein